MKKVIVEQLLYGYDNGHTLLASSLHENLNQQKNLEILSDASGIGKFDSYITCFPLAIDGYYVFAKTWYAREMKRPGCVWTHALLIKFDDLLCCEGNLKIHNLFRYPDNGIVSKEYNSKLECMLEEHPKADKYYKYFIYTLFHSDKNVIIEDNQAFEMESTIIDVIAKLPKTMLLQFEICTNSINNRYNGNKLFSYQMTNVGNGNNLSRKMEDCIIYKNKDNPIKYPFWVEYLANVYFDNNVKSLYEYCNEYGECNRQEIKELSKVFYSINELRDELDLEKYLNILQKIDTTKQYRDTTLYKIYLEQNSKMSDWFSEKSIMQYITKLICMDEGVFVKNKIKSQMAKEYAKKIYARDEKTEIIEILQKYIHKKTNKSGELIVKYLIKYLKPDDLYRIFKLDINISSVLIRINPQLLCCKYIWKQNRNVQLELLNCGDIDKIQKRNELITIIVENSKEIIAEEVYDIFGDIVLEVIKKKCLTEILEENFITNWIPLLIKNKKTYIDVLKKTANEQIILELRNNIDSYVMEDIDEMKVWISVFNHRISNYGLEERYRTSLFMLPIILKFDGEESNNLLETIFEEIDFKLKESSMEYEAWKKIDPILPGVNIEQSWDKCLRLRLAFEKKRYNVS